MVEEPDINFVFLKF